MRLDTHCNILILLNIVFIVKPAGRSVHRANASLRSFNDNEHRLNKQITINDLLGLTSQDGLKKVDNVSTANGLQLWKLEQNYQNIPVFDTCVTAVVSQSGQLTGVISGSYVQGLNQDASYTSSSLKPILSKAAALEIVIKSAGHSKHRKNIRYVRFLKKIYVDSVGVVHPIYEIDYLVKTDRIVQRPAFLLDSHTGSILLKWSKLDAATRVMTGYGGNRKSGQFDYGKEKRMTSITQKANDCYFENEYAKVIDVSRNENHFQNPISFRCGEIFNDSRNEAYSPARDALFYATSLWQMFQEWYHIKLMFKKSVLAVHYNMDNAFWDGQIFNFGDGSKISYPYIVADIVGHELAHAFTDSRSRLLYFGQSGAINEAFSDITGETLEAYLSVNDWSIGRYVLKNGDGFRFMDNPSRDNLSVSHFSKYSQSLDPHYGSGIYNRIFYNIVQHFGVSIKDAFHAMLLANRIFWHSTSNFVSAACDVLRAAYYLNLNVRAFRDAFYQAGIETCSLLQDIHVLNTEETLFQLIVAPNKKPLFIFEQGPLYKNISIWATSEDGQVCIRVFTQDVEPFRSTFQKIAECTTTSVLGVKPSFNKTIFIEFSENTGRILENVRILVTTAAPNESKNLKKYFNF